MRFGIGMSAFCLKTKANKKKTKNTRILTDYAQKSSWTLEGLEKITVMF